MALEVGRKVEIGNACAGIRSSDSESLGRGAWASDASRASVAVGGSTEHNSSDRIMVSYGIVQPLHNEGTNSLRLDISISCYIKCVA